MRVCAACSERYADDAAFCPLDGSALTAAVDPFIGRTLAGRYRIIRRLGQGSTSVVYLAQHVVIERQSAIKILRRDLTRDPQHRERFLREARAVNRIHHPGIVEIIDLGEVDGTAYLVMEYAESESLHDTLKRGVLPWRRVAHIAGQLAAALARAHAAGVIHRDLKPENVLVMRDGGADPQRREPRDRVKLTDFGIAKLLDAPALTLSEQTFGTAGYIPPEVVQGAPVDARADLYGLGVLMYESLTGKLPFDAKSPLDRMLAPLTLAPVPLRTREVNVPEGVEALIMALLARAPQDRPTDAFFVEDALTTLLQSAESSDDTAPCNLVGRDQTLSTAVDAALEGAPRATENVGWLQTSASSSRWGARLIAARKALDAANAAGRSPDARSIDEALLVHATELVSKLDRVTREVADAQVGVDRLESDARTFGHDLSRALEALGRLRTTERAQYVALLVEETRLQSASPPPGRDSANAGIPEGETVHAQQQAALSRERDLSSQIVELQLKLEAEQGRHQNAHAHATATLEGTLAAAQAMSLELTRTLADLTRA